MVDPEDTTPEVEDKMTEVIERSLMFHPPYPVDNRTIVRQPSWTVYHVNNPDSPLFVTESPAFLRWWMETYPLHTIKENET